MRLLGLVGTTAGEARQTEDGEGGGTTLMDGAVVTGIDDQVGC